MDGSKNCNAVRVRNTFSGDFIVTADDIMSLSHPTLRHRILVNYKAEAEGVAVEQVVDRLLEHVPNP